MKDCLNFFSWYRHANWNTHRRFAIVNNSTTLYSRNVKLLRINFQVERLLVIENFSSIFIIFTTYKLEISQKVIDKFIQEFRTYREQNYTCLYSFFWYVLKNFLSHQQLSISTFFQPINFVKLSCRAYVYDLLQTKNQALYNKWEVKFCLWAVTIFKP